jgi:hypothetical protein
LKRASLTPKGNRSDFPATPKGNRKVFLLSTGSLERVSSTPKVIEACFFYPER